MYGMLSACCGEGSDGGCECRVGEEMPLHDSNVLAMVYSHDLEALITASQDTTIRVHWHNLRFALPFHAFPLSFHAFSLPLSRFSPSLSCLSLCLSVPHSSAPPYWLLSS